MRKDEIVAGRRRLSKVTRWQTYAALALLLLIGGAVVFGFNGEQFKPATGSARAMALSAD